MNIYKEVANNIKYYMSMMAEDEEYKLEYPNTSIEEYVSMNTKIKYSRLINVLNSIEEITIDEVYRISVVLRINIADLFVNVRGTNEEKK